MRMAGRFSRRLRAWAKANNVPVVYCGAGERKHEIAEEHLSTKQVKPGLFLVLVSKAPALVWEAQMTGTGKLGQLVPDRKSTRLNSSHRCISYAVFFFKKANLSGPRSIPHTRDTEILPPARARIRG